MKLATFGLHLLLCVCSARCVFWLEVEVMDEEAQRVTVSWENGTLAPVDHLRLERADSPTPGLVEGSEPGELQA